MMRTISLVMLLIMSSSMASAMAPSISALATEAVFAQSKVHKKAIRQIENGNSQSDRPHADLDIDALLARFRVPGVSIAVFENFEVVWARGYGYAHVQDEVRVTPTTTFQAGSISKPVAAMAALVAVQQGRFDLDDPINDLLTSWQLPDNDLTAKRTVTPRMLLSHTGGTTVHGFPGYEPHREIPLLPELLSGTGAANTQPVIVDLEPFTQYRYSGGGTTIMELAMEDMHQEAFEDILARTVLKPLGMTNSTFVQPMTVEVAPNAAFAHGGKGKAPWHIYPTQAAAGLWTTPTDLAKFAIAVQKILRGDEGGVLTQEMALAMVTPAGAIGPYGLGFNIEGTGGNKIFGHGGSDWGFISQLLAHRDKGFGLAIMTNGSAGGKVGREIQARIVDAYGWNKKSE